MRDRLTAKQVENAKPGRYGDGGGLWLEVSTSRAKHWTLRYQIDGRARWMGLGSAEVVTLADARERARLAKLALVDGIDPLDARRARPTMASLDRRGGHDPRQPPRGRDRHRACVEGGRADLAAGANDGRPDAPAGRGGA